MIFGAFHRASDGKTLEERSEYDCYWLHLLFFHFWILVIQTKYVNQNFEVHLYNEKILRFRPTKHAIKYTTDILTVATYFYLQLLLYNGRSVGVCGRVTQS